MKKTALLLLTIACVLCVILPSTVFASTASSDSVFYQNITETCFNRYTESLTHKNIRTDLQNTAQTSAQSAVVMEIKSGRVLFSKNADIRLPMASTTKIMTALVAVELTDINETVKIDNKAVGVEGSSIYLRQGETLTVKDLLYGLMLRSGNDCAVALAIHIGGSVEKFAELMNAKAEFLVLQNTHFVNPHGLHDDNHYTSAYDLAIISCAAMKNPIFREIVSTKKITIGIGDSERLLINKNKLLYNYQNACGVKTGYTKRAGRCFVGAAENGTELVCVVLNCGPMFEETKNLLTIFQNEYETRCIVPKNKICLTQTKNGKKEFLICPKAFWYPLGENEISKIEKEIVYDENESCYIINVYLGKQLIFYQKLYTI
ncbi:MAG TPA: D-alanyl-D-alanine carboxypeptidase family protein [Clostridia bacterium]|nr:D-alanyl-D-alanine carboxypeptidase family protein [Clostridia bacterium]